MHRKANRVKVQLWMPAALHDRVEAYAAGKLTKNSEAVRRLVMAGLEAEAKAAEKRARRQRTRAEPAEAPPLPSAPTETGDRAT